MAQVGRPPTKQDRNAQIAEWLYLALDARVGLSLRVASQREQKRTLDLLYKVRTELKDPRLAQLTFRRAPGDALAIWIAKVKEWEQEEQDAKDSKPRDG